MLQYLEHEVGPRKPRIRVRQSNWSNDSFDVIEFDDFLKLREFFMTLSLGGIEYIGNGHLDEYIERYIKEKKLGPSPLIPIKIRDIDEGVLFEYDGEIFARGVQVKHIKNTFKITSIATKIFKQSIGRWVYRFNKRDHQISATGEVIVKLFTPSFDSRKEELDDAYNKTRA